MLKLWDYFRSSACFRVRIALNIKNLPFESIPVHLVNNGGEQHSATYEQINPQHLVPALQDKEMTLTQSLAIIEYLDECYPAPRILPDNPEQRALVRAFALTIAADTHPLNNLRVLNYLKNTLHVSEEQKLDWYNHWMKLGLDALEALTTKHAISGQYCFGDTITLADVCLVPHMYNARRFNCDLSAYPNLVRIDEKCQQIAAVKNAWPIETTV